MAKEKRFDVIVAGYAGYDLAVSPVPQNIMDVDTGTAPQRIITVGGDGINAATSFASLGCKTALCSAVGRDMFAKTVRNHLKEHSIDARYVFDVDAPTTFTLILVGEDGERHCLIRRGATESICRDMVPAEAIENARHLLIVFIGTFCDLSIIEAQRRAAEAVRLCAFRPSGQQFYNFIGILRESGHMHGLLSFFH